MFEQVFFRFGEFFAGLVLAEAVASTRHSGRLVCEDKVFVVGAVEEGHEALLTCDCAAGRPKGSQLLIDEQLLFDYECFLRQWYNEGFFTREGLDYERYGHELFMYDYQMGANNHVFGVLCPLTLSSPSMALLKRKGSFVTINSVSL